MKKSFDLIRSWLGWINMLPSYGGERLEPREFREGSTDEAGEIGNDEYLIVGEDIWDPATDREYLPDAWFRKTRRGRVPDGKKAGRFPHKLFFDEYGNCSDSKPLRYRGWFMTEPLLFDPTGGIFFDPKRNEGSKLTKLAIEYQGLPEIVRNDTFWAEVPIVSGLSCPERIEFLSTVLDFFRLEFALHSNNFLTPLRLKEQERLFREKLKAPWTLAPDEDLRPPTVILLDPLHHASRLPSKSMGPAGALGKFLKFTAKRNGVGEETLHGEDYRRFVLQLMGKLREAD